MAKKIRSSDLPGIAFEKLVASMQSQIDPTSTVIHNEQLIDRLGHARQFDVVIRGQFAGQTMLGVIECKDLKRKVGNPEIDAFVTKSRDVNANFKLLISRMGFSKPALEKCADYGIEALSLLESDPVNKEFFLGTRWTGDLMKWGQIKVALTFVESNEFLESFVVENLKINGKSVLDGIINYLIEYEKTMSASETEVSCIVNFEKPRIIKIDENIERLCDGFVFQAERKIERLEYRMGMNADGFFNWNRSQIIVPPGGTVITEAVPTDLSLWKPRVDETWKQSGFIEVHLTGTQRWFNFVENAINLDVL